MAKELPYFKFEPNQWDNGNIQICSHLEKGVFIDLCSMYWSRIGDVPYKLAVQKICGGNATALDSLYENKIIDIIDGNIYIKYLSEQLMEFENTSSKNRQNALDGWVKRRDSNGLSKLNAIASNSHSEVNAIREDKIREDKIENIENRKLKFANSLKPFLSIYGKDLLNDFYGHWTQHGENDKKFLAEKQKSFGIERRLQTWKRNDGKFGNSKQLQKLDKL